jgi:hypothetical protein
MAANFARCCLRGFLLQVPDVDIAMRIAGDRHNRHAAHSGARRVRPMRGNRDQTNVPLSLPALPVVRSNDHQPGVLALGSGIWLQ